MPSKRFKKLPKDSKMLDPNVFEKLIPAVKKNCTVKFDESIELAFKMTIDPRKTDQMIRGTVRLPHGSGKEVKVLVFAKEVGAVEAAKEAGAEFVGFEEYIEKVTSGWTGFDVAVATPEAMGEVRKLGRVLGPRGLMPNPKTGTVTREIAQAVKEAKAGRVEYRADSKSGNNAQAPIGKLSFEDRALIENAQAFTDAILRGKPAAAKGHYINKLILSSVMGPGIKIDRTQLAA